MKLDFAGQTVVVTGATRGIGRRVAEEFAALDAHLLLTGVDADRVCTLAAELPGAGIKRCFSVDFTDGGSTAEFLAVLRAEPRVDVCVNNAGINRLNPVDAVRDEDWKAIQAVNLEAPLVVTRAVAAGMIARGYGRIVNIASIFGLISKPKRALYSMSKYGLRGLTVAAALDLAPHNVLVNAVAPGFVRTALTTSILSPEEQAALAAQVPLGRFAEVEEIARVVLFLASPFNSYITAQTIVVDGGFVNV